MRPGLFSSSLLTIPILFAATYQAQAQNVQSAKTFVQSIFKLYGPPQKPGISADNEAHYLEQSLFTLVKADEIAAEAVHEVPGPLDADLICDCQEWDGIFVRSLSVRIDAKGRALVDARFDIYLQENRTKDDLRKMRYTLVFVGGGWRIYDIEDLSRSLDPGHSRSLRREIERDILDLRRDAKELR
jgi:hypothetical protein